MLLALRLGETADTRMISLWQQSAPSTASRSCVPLRLPFPKGDQPVLTSHHVICAPFLASAHLCVLSCLCPFVHKVLMSHHFPSHFGSLLVTASRSYAPLELPSLNGDTPLLTSQQVAPLRFMAMSSLLRAVPPHVDTLWDSFRCPAALLPCCPAVHLSPLHPSPLHPTPHHSNPHHLPLHPLLPDPLTPPLFRLRF